jgi:hypothetical protein
MEAKRNAYTVLVGETLRRGRTLGRRRCRWQDIIKIVVGEIECDHVD